MEKRKVEAYLKIFSSTRLGLTKTMELFFRVACGSADVRTENLPNEMPEALTPTQPPDDAVFKFAEAIVRRIFLHFRVTHNIHFINRQAAI
jgi:hypothetical protein